MLKKERKMKRSRTTVRATLVLATVAVLAVLMIPAAQGASSSSQLIFLNQNQPQDAEQGATITSSDFVSGNSFIKVELVDGSGNPITNSTATVTFDLATGPVFATGKLDVVAQPLVNGIATFAPTTTGAPTLAIETPNEPHFTSYALVPRTAKGQPITGPASAGFDVYESGDSCVTTVCTADIRSGLDVYTKGSPGTNSPGTLGASQLPASALPGLNCPGQAVVFATSVFVNATTDANSPPSPDPVFVSNHITKTDWKASHNNGQAHADWCVGLTREQLANVNNGGTYVQEDTDGVDGLDLFVGLAPKCPSKDPQLSAPCIVSQTGDGLGGSTTLGWLPGGDPPRRT